MRVMITGADGFVGRALVQRLLTEGRLRGRPISALILLDQDLQGFPEDPRLRRQRGSLCSDDFQIVRRAQRPRT